MAGASSVGGLWGGRAAGTETRRSSARASQTSSATRRWPKWIGLNDPPKTPTRRRRLLPDGPVAPPAHTGRWPKGIGLNDPPKTPTRCRRLLPDVPVAPHDELGRGQLPDAHRTPRVHPGGGDAPLGAQAELAAIHPPGGGVDQPRRRGPLP